MKKLPLIPILFAAFGSLPLFAVDEEDLTERDPDIILPPMFLEIEDSTRENVKTILPGGDRPQDIVLPELTAAMPDPTDSDFDSGQIDAFLAKVSDQKSLTSDENPTDRQALPVRLDAHAELGTVGEIGLGFHLFGNTEKSQFGFSAEHQSRDGFGFRPWGGRFFDRRETVSGNYTYRNRILSNQLEAGLEASAFGTQDLTEETDTRRDLFFSVKDLFSLNAGALHFSSSVGWDMAHRYADDVGNGSTDLFLEPQMNWDILLPKTRLSIHGGYAWNGSLFDRNHGHSADLLFEFDTELPRAVNLGGGIGLFWDGREKESVYGTDLLGFSVPFYLQLYGSAADFFRYRFKGGFENERQSYARLSRRYRYLAPAALPAFSGWFSEAELDFRIRQIAMISVGLDFDRKSGTVLIENPETGADGLIPVSTGIENLLYASIRAQVIPIGGLEIKLGWEGSLLPAGQYYLKPLHRVEGELAYTIPQKWFCLKTKISFEHYDISYIPVWDVEAFFRFNEHFCLTAALDDLLSPIYKEGRPTVWGGYIDPGLGASLLLEIQY